jgi:hypothetical protein
MIVSLLAPKTDTTIDLIYTIKKLISRKGFLKILDLAVEEMTIVTDKPKKPPPIDEIPIKLSIIYSRKHGLLSFIKAT